jgi:methylated-DNA-[protein]-cysteine S-methyltransferase
MELQIDQIESNIGTIVIITDHEKLCALDFADYEQRMVQLLQKRYQQFQLIPVTNPLGVSSRIDAYLQGDYASLDDIPVNPGGTAFQQEVWLALRSIPPGTTQTYGELAAQLGKPNAARAVGLVNSLNPIAIVLPCHRVIGANQSLTGYAGGLARKQWLLQHEGYWPASHQISLSL